jgi:hypothetical protein
MDKGFNMNKIKDISNQKFGKLLVIKFDSVDNGNSKWNCLCDCGNEKIVRAMDLKSHTVQSCGCLVKELRSHKRNLNSVRWTGYMEISGTHFGNIKYSARQRNIKFDLTIEYIWDLFIKQNRRCAISNIELVFSKTKRCFGTTASLDRIDSSKGYIERNVQWIHKDINYMKTDMLDKEFINWCKIIVDYQRIK